MARKKAPPPEPPARTRNPDVRRMCRYCATPHPETDYPPGTAWICQPCKSAGVLPIIPLRVTEGWARYDTAALFAGYKIVRNPTGERAQYETEVHSPHGVFYAVAEAAFCFMTQTTQMGRKLLKEFPEARLQGESDNGESRVIFPAGSFKRVAKRVGAYKPRKVSDSTKALLAANREAIKELKTTTVQDTLDL